MICDSQSWEEFEEFLFDSNQKLLQLEPRNVIYKTRKRWNIMDTDSKENLAQALFINMNCNKVFHLLTNVESGTVTKDYYFMLRRLM